MAATIQINIASSPSQSNALSRLEESSSTLEGSVVTDEKKNVPTTRDKMSDSQSSEITINADPATQNEESRETAETMEISSDKNEDDDILLLLEKYKSGKEKNASSRTLDQNNTEISSAPVSGGKRVQRLIDSDSEDEDEVSTMLAKYKSEKAKPTSSEPADEKDTETSAVPAASRSKNVRQIIDSDSEDEDEVSTMLAKYKSEKAKRGSSGPAVEMNMETSTAASSRSQKVIQIIDSDSEVDDNNDVSQAKSLDLENENSSSKETFKKKMSALLDSESEDNETSRNSRPTSPSEGKREVTLDRKKKRTVQKKSAKKTKLSSLIDTDSEGDNETKNVEDSPAEEQSNAESPGKRKSGKLTKKPQQSKISSLIDTDSEGDIEARNVENSPINGQSKNEPSAKRREKSAKKRTGTQRASKEEAMRQIHSETQRLIRSSEVSLPYHRPKQRSLQDFLNRKNFIPALPEGLTTAAKVKMSSEIVGKVLEEKEKEAELFYKSSDSEEEAEADSKPTDCTPAHSTETKESSYPDPVDGQMGIEETQKILKIDVQNAHNKKEIIKQGAVDLGVPRKLFGEGTSEFTETDATGEEKIEEDEEEENNYDGEDPRKKRETKHGLREGSVPRKLFGGDYDEGVGSQSRNYDVSTLGTTETTNSQASETVAAPSESLDEGLESLGKEFTSAVDSPVDGKKNECNTVAKEDFATSKISDTPFISNKDIGKVKETDKESRQNDDLEDSWFDNDDFSDPLKAPGHVLGLPLPDMDDDILKTRETLKGKNNKVAPAVSNVCPKLRGAPGMVIDLTDEVRPNKDGVKSLLDRFYRHSVVNKPVEVNTPVKVLHTEKTADGVQIVEHVLPYKLPTSDPFSDKELSKPGAKYLRLKSELIEKMAKKRGEEWRLKEQREKEEREEEEGCCSDEEMDDEFDSEEDVKEVDEEVSGESEPEEDDMPKRKKKNKKKPSEFLDEEAEVSDEGQDEAMEVGSEDDDEEEEEDEDGEENTGRDEDDDLSDADEEEKTSDTQKRTSRIIKAFEDDSNSLPEAPLQSSNNCREKLKKFERTKTDVDMFETQDGNDGWLSDTEAEIPPSQILPRDQADARSQLCKTPLTGVDVLRFVSPMTQLTALNSAMDSPSDRSVTKSQASTKLSIEGTPIDNREALVESEPEKKIGFQKKLFQDPSGTVNDEELMDLCSGTFTGIETSGAAAAISGPSDGKLSASSQASQFLGLSSGSFLSQANDSQKIETNTNPDVDETSQDIRLTLEDDTRDSFDNIIGKETKKESTILSRGKFKVASSSEDEDDEVGNELKKKKNKKKVLKKKKVKQLELSDDEDAAELSNEEEEEEENDQLSGNEDEDKYVDYDSEENEVVIVPKKDIKKVAAKFLDEEAELSESEWGSADEDEKDMDKLELEEGDNEEIDENQMRDQLGKMHVRQILDDDRRDVRMLQELLFDDGDLHTEGGGRERQFKWKNIDKLGEDGNVGPGADDGAENGDQVEEENDLEWRKIRLERDKFIQEQMKNPTDEIHSELTQDSNIFKLGQKALSKRKSSKIDEKESDEPVAKKPIVPRTVMDFLDTSVGDKKTTILRKAVKRGSFLARGEESLARLAVQIKNTEKTIITGTRPGNFVFAHISPSVANAAAKKQENDDAEAETDSPAEAKTKKRKPPAGITPRTAKKAKIDLSRSSGKKLF